MNFCALQGSPEGVEMRTGSARVQHHDLVGSGLGAPDFVQATEELANLRPAGREREGSEALETRVKSNRALAPKSVTQTMSSSST